MITVTYVRDRRDVRYMGNILDMDKMRDVKYRKHEININDVVREMLEMKEMGNIWEMEDIW